MLKTKGLCFENLIFYNDIHVKKNKINFIVGESGCGKSTLLKILNKTENYTSGEILFNNQSIENIDSIEHRKNVRLISQTTFLFHGTIEENFVQYYSYCEIPQISTKDMLYFLKLTEAHFSLDTQCDGLSGGEKQRVYLAICISMGGKVLMLDEPTSALDSTVADKVLQNIVFYVKEKSMTLVVISHDVGLTDKFAEHTIDLSGGKRSE